MRSTYRLFSFLVGRTRHFYYSSISLVKFRWPSILIRILSKSLCMCWSLKMHDKQLYLENTFSHWTSSTHNTHEIWMHCSDLYERGNRILYEWTPKWNVFLPHLDRRTKSTDLCGPCIRIPNSILSYLCFVAETIWVSLLKKMVWNVIWKKKVLIYA